MVEQYKATTQSDDGKLLGFEKCLEKINFGNIILSKSSINFSHYKGYSSSNQEIVIPYGDILLVEEIFPI